MTRLRMERQLEEIKCSIDVADGIKCSDMDVFVLCPLPPLVQLPAQTRLPSAGAALKEGEHRGQKKTKEKSTKRVEKKKVCSSMFYACFVSLGQE